jgi:hypothetical protein
MKTARRRESIVTVPNVRTRAASHAAIRTLLCLMSWCLGAFMPLPSHAGMQHLVAPGENWESLAAKVQPGDEIILMPGRHKPAIFEKLQGTRDAPITIRGLDRNRDNIPIISAARHGILITDPQHIIIENLHVTGASIAGIALRSLPATSTEPTQNADALNTANVRLRNVTVTKVGPAGRRDAIEIVGQDHVSIERCEFEGWGGAAIAMIASRNVTIHDCTFKALADHTQTEGVLMRAGTSRIIITNCRFEMANGPSIVAGGKSEPTAFQPAVADDAKPGSVYEALHIQVMRCVFRNSQAPIVMQSADNVLARSCTFHRPKTCVIMFDHKHDDLRFAPAARFIFGDNLVVWEPGDLMMYTLAPPSVDLRNLMWEQNLWWSSESIEARQKLGEFQGGLVSEQIMDVDPRLDEKLQPQAPAAQMYGAFAP